MATRTSDGHPGGGAQSRMTCPNCSHSGQYRVVDGSPVESVWDDGQLVVVVTDELYYETQLDPVTVPRGTIGRIVSISDDDLPDLDGDVKVYWPHDPPDAWHYTHESNIAPVEPPPTADNTALEAWLDAP